MLLGRDLCGGLITRQEEFCRLWCVVVCDLETSYRRRPWNTGGGSVAPKNKPTNKQLLTTERTPFSKCLYNSFVCKFNLIIRTQNVTNGDCVANLAYNCLFNKEGIKYCGSQLIDMT